MLQFEDVLFEVLVERQACGLGSHFGLCSLLLGHECRPGSGFCDLDACESGFLQSQKNINGLLFIILLCHFFIAQKIAFWHHKTKISYYSHPCTFMASFMIVQKPHWRISWKSVAIFVSYFSFGNRLNKTLTLGLPKRIVKKNHKFARTHRLVGTEIHWSYMIDFSSFIQNISA